MPTLSLVVPVYNEESGLPALFARLYPALDALDIPYEVVFVNDGSRHRPAALLKAQFPAPYNERFEILAFRAGQQGLADHAAMTRNIHPLSIQGKGAHLEDPATTNWAILRRGFATRA